MKNKKKNKYKKTFNESGLIILNIVLLLLTILLNVFNVKDTSIYKNLSSFVTTSKNNIEKPLTNTFNKALSNDYDILYKENDNLKEENSALQIELNNYKNLNDELNELQTILEINKLYNEFEVVNAKVIERHTKTFYDELIIDKGEDASLKEGYAVVTSQGLIGKISKVYNTTSVITLISSSAIGKISVVVLSKQEVPANTYSYEDDLILVEGVTNYDNIQIGDKVETSGLGNLPKGLLVGEVAYIKEDSYQTSKILYVKQDSNLSNLSYVAVLKG